MTAKRIVFWIVAISITPLLFLISMIEAFIMALGATKDVFEHLFRLYEYWSFDIPQGEVLNDPRLLTIKEVWLDTFNGTHTSTWQRYLDAKAKYA